MGPRRVVVAATVAALAAGPFALAANAEATPPYSVAVEHCGGGLAIVGYQTLLGATRANTRAVTRQLTHPGTLHKVLLFHGTKAIKVSTRHC